MRQEYGRRLAEMGQQVADRLSPPLPPRMAILAAHGTAPELSAVPSPPAIDAIDMADYRVPIIPGTDPTFTEDKRFTETFIRFVAVTDMAEPTMVSDQYLGRHRHMSPVTSMCYRLGWPVRVWYWLVLHWPGFSPVRVPRSQYRPPLPARSREWTEPAVAEVQVGRSVLLRRLDSGWRDIPPPEARPFFTPAPAPAPALEASAS